MTTIANDVQVEIASAVLSADTSILVNAATAPLQDPPAPATDAVLTLVDDLSDPTAIEIVRYTTVTDNGDGTLTIGGITRAQEGTTAQGFAAGSVAFQSITAALLDAKLETEVNDLTAAVTWADVPDANITGSSVTQHQSLLSLTEAQISDMANYFEVPNRFSELTTQVDRLDAQQNLGLHIIDGGTF